MLEKFEIIEDKFEAVFDWLNAPGQDVIKTAVVIGTFIVLFGLSSLCN